LTRKPISQVKYRTRSETLTRRSLQR
jgi:hypothetical protein